MKPMSIMEKIGVDGTIGNNSKTTLDLTITRDQHHNLDSGEQIQEIIDEHHLECLQDMVQQTEALVSEEHNLLEMDLENHSQERMDQTTETKVRSQD